MKIFLFVLLVTGSVSCCFAQKHEVVLDKEFFLLGTLDEYLGRREDATNSVVDWYYPHEGFVVRVLDSLLKKEYPGLECETEGSGHKQLLSKKLAGKVNAYFSKDGVREGSFMGAKLKKGIFKTDEQKYSYLAGVFLRYGFLVKNDFRIQFANAADKAELCKALFEELGCNVKFESLKTIPRANKFYFTPEGKLEEYLLKAVMMRGNLSQRWEKWGSMPR